MKHAAKPQHAAGNGAGNSAGNDAGNEADPRQADFSGSPGLLDGLRGVAANLLALFVSRIELAALELSEARAHALKLLLIFALAMIAVCFALFYWSALAVYLAWQSLGWKILVIVAAVFTLLAAGLLRYARTLLARGKLSLPATLSELRKDRDALL